MRRVVFGLFLVAACDLPGTELPPQQPAPQQQPPPQYGYYPPPPPQYYPPPPQPAPPPTQPAPAPAPTQPAPAPSGTTPPGYNPWLTMLQDLLKGGAPPLPMPNQPLPPPAPNPQPAPSTIDARGLDLANAINAYRTQNGLAPIPISRSLSKVADTHVHDLATAPKMDPSCNDHSWTNRGAWTSCCYTPDHAQAKCMWYKPSEITAFKGTGYEIGIGQPGDVKPGLILDSKQAITFWSTSQVHNDVLLNKGQWATMKWKAMGAGIIDSHASAWFSDTDDTVSSIKPK